MVRYPSQYVSGVYNVLQNLHADYSIEPDLYVDFFDWSL